MNDFDRAFQIIVGEEGGYVNDPSDPGGETKYGIAKRFHPNVDIKNLTLDQAKDIYREDYWNLIRGDLLPWPLNAYVFDGAVNESVHEAIILLQKTLDVKQDAILGQHTLAAIKNLTTGGQELYLADRALHYIVTENFDKYGRGWFKRLFNIAIMTVGDCHVGCS